MSSIWGGLDSRGASCKRHEMSSIKKLCGEGWVRVRVRVRVEGGPTYLKRLGLGLEGLL